MANLLPARNPSFWFRHFCFSLRSAGGWADLMVIYFFQTMVARHSGLLQAVPVAEVHLQQAVLIFFIFA